jgi:hypothetical protein
MSKRIKLIILISVGIIIIIALLFFVKYIYEQNFPVEKKPIETPLIVEPKIEEQTFLPSEIIPLTKEIKDRVILEKMVSNFIESFGSYSNQSDFQNISGLKIFATSKMQNLIDDFINQEKIKNKLTNNYFGITTKVLAIEEINSDLKETVMKFLINTQREETKESTQNIKVFYQNVLVKLIKQGDDWKVDEVEWKKQ